MVRAASLLLCLTVFACGGTNETSTSAHAAAPKPEMAPDAVLATYDGGKVTWADLGAEADTQLRRIEMEYLMSRHETLTQAVEQKLTEALLADAATKGGHADIDALLKAEVEDKTSPPSDAEIAEFYTMVARQLGGASLEEARPMLAQELTRRAQVERYRTFITGVREAASVEINVPYPELPRIEVPIHPEDPIRGAKDAKVTIVQFAEYQCPYCKRVTPTLDQLLKTYEGKVRIVYKDYPLPNHNRAIPAAVAAHCAREQGKYFEMNDLLMDNQHALADADFDRYATEVGLDMDAFGACRASGKQEELISRGMSEGQAAGVSGTPAFFINGIFLNGAQPYEQFAKLVDQELGSR